MIHLVSLNELVLPKFLFLLLLRRKVKILRIAPIIPKAASFLKRVVNKAIESGRAQYAVTLVPELQEFWDFERRFYFYEAFKKYEPWQNRYYGFDRPIIANDPAYGYGFKQMTCSYTFWKVIEIYLLEAIIRQSGQDGIKAHGVMADTLALGREYFGDDFASNVSAVVYSKILLNIFLGAFATAFTLAWIVRRVRPVVKTETFDVIYDRLRDNREIELLKELKPAGRFLFVERSPSSPSVVPDGFKYQSCLRTDGQFQPLAAVRAMAFAITDIVRLAGRHWQTPPGLLYEMLSLPYKRVLIRGLVNRFRAPVFIGRDEYNVDHIMRRVELRKVSIKSIGMSGGLFPCFSSLAPNIRYVSFDSYYVYASPLFKQYRETWSDDMDVQTMGGFSIPRERQLSQVGNEGEDILFTIRVAWNRPEMVRMVRAVAKAFPDRKVVLQFKRGFISEENRARLAGECGEGLKNFELTSDDVYVLLPRAKFHISDISTFVSEAIRAGATTLLADLLDQEFNCFRLFPRLAVNTADQLVVKLKALESGEEIYPRQKYFELLGYKQGDVGFDLLRKEIGINPTHQAA